MSGFISGIKDFLSSNSTIAKLTFIILLLICFMIVMRMGIKLITWFLGPDPTPHLIDGMIRSSHSKKIHVNPNIKGAKPILKSDNQEGGIEYTWSTWIFIEQDALGTFDEWQHVFHKGYNIPKNNLQTIVKTPEGKPYLFGPGLFLTNTSNQSDIKPVSESNSLELKLIMTTYNTNEDAANNEEIKISNIPSNKWVNVIIRQTGNVTDVYINGTIKERKALNAVPLQNDGNVYIGSSGNPNNFGFISNVWYWNYALGTSAIENIASAGPNTTMTDQQLKAKPYYLAFNWFLRRG